MAEKKTEVSIGCVIMASGESKRFGEDKFFAKFGSKTMLQIVLELVSSLPFKKRVMVTRNKQAEEFARKYPIDIIFHVEPYRSDTIRLGVTQLQDMDACVFFSCDQPLLQRKSIELLMQGFALQKDGIFQLSHKSQVGMPVLFAKEYFEELCSLPQGCGGSYVCRSHQTDISFVEVSDALELFDVDTKEELFWLTHQAEIINE